VPRIEIYTDSKEVKIKTLKMKTVKSIKKKLKTIKSKQKKKN